MEVGCGGNEETVWKSEENKALQWYKQSICFVGVAAGAFENDIDALSQIRDLFDFLPLSNKEQSPIRECNDPRERECHILNTIVPADPLKGYDMKAVIQSVADDGEFYEIMPKWAENIVIGFGRMNGRTVGFVGNQPLKQAGICFDFFHLSVGLKIISHYFVFKWDAFFSQKWGKKPSFKK